MSNIYSGLHHHQHLLLNQYLHYRHLLLSHLIPIHSSLDSFTLHWSCSGLFDRLQELEGRNEFRLSEMTVRDNDRIYRFATNIWLSSNAKASQFKSLQLKHAREALFACGSAGFVVLARLMDRVVRWVLPVTSHQWVQHGSRRHGMRRMVGIKRSREFSIYQDTLDNLL